ncbi:RDD family protein [Microbacterium sp. NPDC087868]|uniref:RDD family protein n=1 Tax=Microbacterium sp. NPDC087868 TaxID=3364195 RepID=UPI00384E637A
MIWEIDDGASVVEGLDAHGRPDPAYAASLGLLPARKGSRVLASLLEAAVAVLLALPALIVLPPILADIASGGFDVDAFFARGDLVWVIVALAVSQVLTLAYVIVQLVMHGRKGVTLGKAVCGIRSVNVRTLERPKFWRGAVVRYLVASASLIVPVIGPVLVIALSPLFDIERRGRGWLDLAAGTWFVDVRRGLNPYDQKRMRIARKSVKISEHEAKAPLPSLATPVDRDAPAEYVPSARLSGGVIGAHRSQTPQPEKTDAAAPGSMVAAVPPSLATGAPPAFPVAPAAAPAPAVPSPAPPASVPAGPVVAPPQAPAAPAPGPAVAQPAPPAQAEPGPAVAAPAAPAPASAPRADVGEGIRAVLVLDSGARVEVRGTTLFGRAPAAAAGEGEAQLIPVPDETRSVSKTHVAVMPARRGVFVVDRASTNGSAIIRDGAETPLVAGHPAELRTGDTVRFGDRTMRVEHA